MIPKKPVTGVDPVMGPGFPPSRSPLRRAKEGRIRSCSNENPFSLLRNLLQHRQPGVLLLLHEGEDLLRRHGARIAADIAEPLLEVRIADDFGQVDADLA